MSDSLQDKRSIGLFNKFTVTRNDGQSEPGCKHHGCEYFVLDLNHDPFARAAIIAYAEACESEYPGLARDLMGKAVNAQLFGQGWVPSLPTEGEAR